MQIENVLLSPVVTEKSSASQASRKYVFRVAGDSNKIEITRAVEKLYGVKVESVNVMSVRKKVRLAGRGREMTKRPASKKAIITLKPKQTIDFNKIKASK